MNCIGYLHWFIYIIISQLNDHSISVYQDIYMLYLLLKKSKHCYNNNKSKFHKNNLSHDRKCNKEDASTSDEPVEVLSIEYNIHFRACVRLDILTLHLLSYVTTDREIR